MLNEIKNFRVEPIDANESDSYQDPELYDGTTVNPWISVLGEHEGQGVRVILNCHEDHAEQVAARLNGYASLEERVRILREALERARESLDYVSGYLDKEDSETVVESVSEAIDAVDDALEATKEA